jgi:hypothetical protein
MCAAAEPSRTAYSIMHLTKDELIKIHSEEAFDGFEETMANLATTAEMLKAVVQMIEGARGRMLASACACLQKRKPLSFAYRHEMDWQVRRKPLR